MGFFVGLCFEIGGAKKQMLEWYQRAAEYHHRFYLPYIKLAKVFHSNEQFEKAKEYYETGIACLLEMTEGEKDEVMLGSAYTNLTSCLIMLYRYPAAEAAWELAQQYPLQPGASSTAAILYAAMGNAEKSKQYIDLLKESAPAWTAQTQAMVQQILDGKHPHFSKETED